MAKHGETLKGYTVEILDTSPGNTMKPKARLTGPRGAAYDLFPNANNPQMLFAINAKGFTKTTPFDGRWFKLDGDDLKANW